MGSGQSTERRPCGAMIAVLSVLLFSLCIPAVQANLSESSSGEELFLSCTCYSTVGGVTLSLFANVR